jgi:hypothetical protein
MAKMSQSQSKDKTIIIAAIITGVFGCVAAAVGLGSPIIKNLADRYIPTFTPAPSNPSGIGLENPTSTPITQIIITTEVPSIAPPSPTYTPFAPATVTEILPEGVLSVDEMPAWLAENVGGTPNQWKRVQNGKWRFRAGNAGGVGDNQILSPKVGYLVFGADSGQKDSNGGVIWKDVSIGAGESTFWRCDEPNKPGTIDAADWVLFNPNIGTSCN